ncbi:testis expressed protein 56-like [Pteronotus mesoamericanus]|uniref:testis expressed protein 56-like n=1 Tax=Pteronotus mesoamericanus TaxID=1884717 RepID=UPI0023EDA1E6|nr:testis expressed protein 56-like [Pteronotus parnellii mesoamericanus]
MGTRPPTPPNGRRCPRRAPGLGLPPTRPSGFPRGRPGLVGRRGLTSLGLKIQDEHSEFQTKWVIMRTAKNNQIVLKLPLLDKCNTPKSYDHPEVLRHTFENLSKLHKLLPNHLMETLYSYNSEQDKQKCENSELSGLERILARHEFPEEINLTPNPSSMSLCKTKTINNANYGWKKCHLLSKNIKDPPMSTIVVRWLKKNMQPTEDLHSIIERLSLFGPIKSVNLCGRQSAIVVFENMTSACKAVNAFQSRIPGTMFQCSWQQQFMSKYGRSGSGSIEAPHMERQGQQPGVEDYGPNAAPTLPLESGVQHQTSVNS